MAIAFTDMQVVPEVNGHRWMAFSFDSRSKDDYVIASRTVVLLNGLQRLRRLGMTGIKMSPAKGWMQLDIKGIEHLDVAATNVDDRNARFLSSGKDLMFVDLSGTSIGDASLVHLLPHRKLSRVRLNGTQVGDEGLVRLAAMQSLKVIELIDTRVTEAGLKSYKAAGGNAEVILAGDTGGVL